MPDFPDLDHWLPQVAPVPRRPAPPYDVRHPTEADLAVAEASLRDWRDERSGRSGPGRIWFRHLGGTSWVAEEAVDRRLLGVLLGLRSADRSALAPIHLVAVDPLLRRRGIGRELVERFAAQLAATGATTVEATCRPDDRRALAFFAALGFAPQADPGSSRIYGQPAFADWEGTGEDRVLLVRAAAR
ncbi:MAG TPA: GNAT family N-acetyltransferase [Patescibacteria group bacterium]|nr:GNAT family N-acetyltransferase [Patescibacteria group bacterium]